jgi:hypothetical protein
MRHLDYPREPSAHKLRMPMAYLRARRTNSLVYPRKAARMGAGPRAWLRAANSSSSGLISLLTVRIVKYN